MENLQSDWIDENADSKYVDPELSCVHDVIADDPKPNYLFANENFINSPTFSTDSNENLGDESNSKTEHPLLKTSIINASLAKKRLQAYSKQVRKSPVKEEKVDNKFQKEVAKKTKKDLYPGAKAKAVIQEIEEIKRKDQEFENLKKKEFEDLCRRLAVTDAIRCQLSDSPDRNKQFKRRGIKQRNYRRTDSFSRKSPTPEDVKNKDRYSPVHKHPKDWTEFKKQNLSIPKDGSRGRPFARKGFSVNLLEKLYNLDVPSPPIVPCRIEMENGIKEVPLHSIKVTNSRPHIIYSVNTEKIKDSFPTRHQLYGFITKERQQCIRDVINKRVKVIPETKKPTSRPWYNKQWRKSFTECKVLEKSVGLSFLQNYSDEEDDIETEEIVICSTTKKNVETPVLSNLEYEPISTFARGFSDEFLIKEAKYEKQGSISKTFSDSKSDTSVFTPERNRLESVAVVNESVLEDETGILTPDISALPLLQIQKSIQKSEERKNENEQMNKENKLDLKYKKKKKRKLENEQSEDDTPKKKKKRKSRSRRSSSSEDSNSYNGNKKKKKQKKTKTRANRSTKRKAKTDTTEIKLKKKDKRINKKSKQLIRTLNQSPMEDVEKKPKKKIKKQEEANNKKSNKKEATPEKTPKQKRVLVEDSDSESEHSKGEKISEDQIQKTEQIKQKRIKKENTVDEKHEPLIDIVIKKEPEDETFFKSATNNVAKTPDTNNYCRNWEKDDQLWEIEDENIPKEKYKLNSSCWESDEELYEKRLPERRPIEKFIETNEIRDLEIPLNIKPFKKREIQVVKLDNIFIEEAKREDPIEEKNEVNVTKELEKRCRWDKKDIEPKTEQTTYTILENEYEEFMKAVNSNTNTSPTFENRNTIGSDPNNHIDNVTKEESKIIIAPNDIPFIPMPDELKLQPVPSPRIVNTQISQMKINLSPKIAASSTSDTDGKTDIVTTPHLTDQTKSFSFTTLMLPSKKVLIDNSNLKLGDSDDEEPLKPIEVKKELTEPKQTQSVIESPKEKSMKNQNTIKNDEFDESKVKLYSISQSDHKLIDKSPSRDSSRRRGSQSFKYRRESPRRKTYSPPREYSPRRRRKSPERYRSRSPTSRKYHPRRHYSPHRRRTPSPRRRSPRRSVSPRNRTNKRILSRTDNKKEKVINEFKNVLSSPLEGTKRSVADSTISDDSLLPQPNLEEYAQSPVSYYMGQMKSDDGKRLSLDERINIELGLNKDDFKPITTTYDNFCQNRFSDNSQIENYTMDKNNFNENISTNFVQLGNMVEIVPTDLNLKTETHMEDIQSKNKPRILQVGNVLQIVPTELPPAPPPLPSTLPIAVPPPDEIVTNSLVTPEKQSVEISMKQKIEERKAEREKRKLERETKRKEKENRRREKEKRRQIKMKEKTENMIKKALQLEVENQDEEGDVNIPAQWPPIHISNSSKDLICKRSILLKYGRLSKSRKKVQFADGIRPGEGTSPSAGEDLTSPPPPSKVLPKEKRYTKTKLGTKHVKKKVKVKIIKSNEALLDESEEDDNLPPPSPPPGSPPPHIFPPRIKPQIVTNHGYVPSVVNQSQSVYRPPVNMLMMQPPLPDSPMQIHSYQQYQVPPLAPSTTLTPGVTESAAVTVHRNHFNYSL
ncbi:titin-like [Diorhabda sublineata]|uniref:titin-like n=1 Tax=Diorhabda sublineata TaxID=1163346 RepID=UPI0024E09DFC|nr:titin-like [Diorhabda sublineata]